MSSALTYKELRESAPVAICGALALLLVVTGNMDVSPLVGPSFAQGLGQIPFVSDSFLVQFGIAAGLLAAVLGFKQSISDFSGDAQLFLLHRPIRRQRIYGTKLVVGLGICLALAAVTVLVYAAWAASPGTHPSPFHWTMTQPAWTLCWGTTALYLGAFLSGIRPAAWLGTRTAPFFAAALLGGIALALPIWIGWPLLVALDILLTVLILHVTATRDFA